MSQNVSVDAGEIERFLTIISGHITDSIKRAGSNSPGVLNLCRISPLDSDKVLTQPFAVDDVKHMVEAAVADAAHLNCYVETRTVRPGLRGCRGDLNDTRYVFALVVDSDADKAKGCNLSVRPSLTVETSPGNHHFWFFLSRPICADEARTIGDAMRASTGADSDTGVVTQFYRISGSPNYPNKKKQARGRIAIEPTRIIEETGRLWDPDELLAAFSSSATSSPATSNPAASSPTTPPAATTSLDESTLPADLLADIQNGGNGRGDDKSRSALFQSVVRRLRQRCWSVENIVELFQRYPNGVSAKYQKRLEKEVRRSYSKTSPAAASNPQPAPSQSQTPPPPPPSPPLPPQGTGGTAAGPQPHVPHVLPTIRLEAGRLPHILRTTERALLDSGAEIFTRTGTGILVYPAFHESVAAADGRKTLQAKFSTFTPDSFTLPVAECAIFEKYNRRQKAWTVADPPVQLVRMLLSREAQQLFPLVSGIITTPTLRHDGTLLCTPGYDLRSELYLIPGLTLPAIPDQPTKVEALAALAVLKDLFSEFSFRRKDLDLSVALAGLISALLRGSLPTAPAILVRGDGPGVGKSLLVDIIAMVVTGQLCPVTTFSSSEEEVEKRVGALVLAGAQIFSFDNCDRDLEGQILNQLTERSMMTVRILGRSEMPVCECHTAVFATGNGIGYAGDMLRRGLICELKALSERPELRQFKRDALAIAYNRRAEYVAAALTIVRAYIAAGRPRVCDSLGSYGAWSSMVRSPLVWLGERDPRQSMDEVRAENPELLLISEFHQLWLDYRIPLSTAYTVARIIELAEVNTPSKFNPPALRDFLLRIARDKNRNEISPERLGSWLRKSCRIVGDYQLVRGRDSHTKTANYALVKII
jgi:putative DNA primase/helicase